MEIRQVVNPACLKRVLSADRATKRRTLNFRHVKEVVGTCFTQLLSNCPQDKSLLLLPVLKQCHEMN